jgi:hypothetical protein
LDAPPGTPTADAAPVAGAELVPCRPASSSPSPTATPCVAVRCNSQRILGCCSPSVMGGHHVVSNGPEIWWRAPLHWHRPERTKHQTPPAQGRLAVGRRFGPPTGFNIDGNRSRPRFSGTQVAVEATVPLWCVIRATRTAQRCERAAVRPVRDDALSTALGVRFGCCACPVRRCSAGVGDSGLSRRDAPTSAIVDVSRGCQSLASARRGCGPLSAAALR